MFYRVGVGVLMAILYNSTVCTEVTVHITISTGQTAAPDDAEAAPNCCFITQKKKKKRTSSPLLSAETPHIQRQLLFWIGRDDSELFGSADVAGKKRRYDAG